MTRRPKQSRVIDNVIHWQCTKCKQWKKAKEFGIDRHKSNGIHSSCRKCFNAKCNLYYKKHGKEMLENQRKYNKKARRELKKSAIKRRLAQPYSLSIQAHRCLGKAIKEGKIKPVKQCQKEGCNKTKLYPYIIDYTEPFQIEWYCLSHIHQEQRKKTTIIRQALRQNLPQLNKEELVAMLTQLWVYYKDMLHNETITQGLIVLENEDAFHIKHPHLKDHKKIYQQYKDFLG